MNYEDEQEIDLVQVFEIIRKNLLLFIAICFVCCSAALCVTKFLMEEKFTAEAKMIIVQKSDSASNQQNYTYSDVQLSQKLASTYSEIIMSEAISDQVVSNLNLYELYEIDSQAYSKIVKVSSANNTEVINIDVTTNNPQLSANIANEIVDVFEEKIYDIMQIENVTTLTDAKVPLKKSAPSTTRNVAIGGLIGMLICMVIVIKELFTDVNIKTEDEVKAIFDLPVIGNIPYFEIDDEKEVEDNDGL